MDRVSCDRGRTADESVRSHLDCVCVVAIRLQVLLVRRCAHVHVIAHVVVVADDVVAAATTVTSQAVADHDPGGSVETILQVVTDHTEVGQAHPARLDCAGSGHSVAFAFFAHLGLYVL